MKKHRVSVIIFYDDNGKLLVQKKGSRKQGNSFRFFGGHIEKGETPEQALIREIKEELNFDINDFEFFNKYQFDIEELNNHIEMHCFLANIPEIELTPSDEGDIACLNFNKVSDYDFSKHDKKVLKEIIDFLGFKK
ncbi:MAG: NUDIX hydrolase [Candidatus Nanoarchaeia archaeon]